MLEKVTSATTVRARGIELIAARQALLTAHEVVAQLRREYDMALAAYASAWRPAAWKPVAIGSIVIVPNDDGLTVNFLPVEVLTEEPAE